MKFAPSTWYLIALIGFFGLFTLIMLWHTLLSPQHQLPIAFLLLLTVTPLLLPMRGFLHGKLRSCAWLAYISLMYFLHGAIEAYANVDARPLALLEIALSLMIFFGISFYLRSVKSIG
jgi:uncharacterized membrane protein